MSRIGRLGCQHCSWNGYTRHTFWNGENEETSVTMCSQCKDIRGYNMYIKQKYSSVNNLHVLEGGEPEADVIDFQIYKDLKEMKYYSKVEAGQMAKNQFEKFGVIPKAK